MIEPERDAPDLEDLAAYVDGRLSGELKARVEERLARDEDYYEVFLETVRFQEEQGREQQAGGEVVAPAAWWRSRRIQVAAPLAAAAVLAAAVGVPRLIGGPPTAELVARLDAQVVLDNWVEPGWNVNRGELDPDLLRRQELAFRLGTRTVDLTVALEAGDLHAAGGWAAQLEKLAAGHDVLLPLGFKLTELITQIDGGDLAAAAKGAAQLEAHLADLLKRSEARYFDLGRWNEAGRLAALTDDDEVLAGVFRGRRVARGIEAIEGHLGDLEAALEARPPDFEAADRAFSGIARKLAGRG